MSFLNSPQYASVTTKLLTIIDDRMPRRHQVIVAVLIVFLALASIAGSRPAERPAQLVQPAPIVIIVTATPYTAGGLAKRAARIAPIGGIVPTPAPAAPTLAPAPVIMAAPIVADPPTPIAPPTKAPEPTAPSRFTIR